MGCPRKAIPSPPHKAPNKESTRPWGLHLFRGASSIAKARDLSFGHKLKSWHKGWETLETASTFSSPPHLPFFPLDLFLCALLAPCVHQYMSCTSAQSPRDAADFNAKTSDLAVCMPPGTSICEIYLDSFLKK